MKKRKIIFCFFMLISLVFISFSNFEMVRGKGFSIIDTGNNEISNELTIADLEWHACDSSRDGSLPFTPLSSGGYTYDKTDTSLHFRESTGTYQTWAGWYSTFEIPNGIFSMEFEGKAKAGHSLAVQLYMNIYDNQTKQILRYTELITNWDGCYQPEGLETDYISFNITSILPGTTEVLIFFLYSDGYSTNWNQEFWVRNLSINTDLDTPSLLSETVTKVISAPITRLAGLEWRDNNILSNGADFVTDTTAAFEIDPETMAILDSHSIVGSNGLAFDGKNFWTTATNYLNTDVSKYDSSFNYIGSIDVSLTYVGGIASDGTNLWVAHYNTDTIYKINKDTGDTVSTIPSPSVNPRDMKYFDDALWVVDSLTHQFYKISPSDGTILETYDSAFEYPYGITVDDDGFVWLSIRSSHLIYKTNVNAIFDAIAPLISSSGDLEYLEDLTSNYISWVLEDSSPDNYEIYRNGILQTSGTWINGENVSINVDLLPVGTYNYTIVAKDVYDNEASSTIWVTVIETEKTSFFWISAVILIFVPFISKRRRK